ncbi:hypothetical protein RJT34_15472 [Clitoria ternatea]|uniref:Uncharacterized protein n=1 Tax=Clitoria ternatea TaxID=43366 RepID=A0AAN9J6W0_CLITE
MFHVLATLSIGWERAKEAIYVSIRFGRELLCCISMGKLSFFKVSYIIIVRIDLGHNTCQFTITPSTPLKEHLAHGNMAMDLMYWQIDHEKPECKNLQAESCG